MRSKLSRKEKKSLEYYDKYAQEWAEGHSRGNWFQGSIDKLFELVPSGKVLEIGAGHGRDAKQLVSHFGKDNYLGFEPSKGLIKLARNNNPEVQFLQKSIYDLDEIDDKFDAFWINAVFVHLPKSRVQEVLKLLHRRIKDGGVGFISVLEGKGDLRKGKTERYFSLWKKSEFDKELDRTGYKVLSFEKVKTKHSIWLTYLLKVI